MKKLMMLGAGSCQLNAIKKIKELGYTAVVSDNQLTSPGKKIGDVSVLADTFSFVETCESAIEHKVDGIMTSGTDQPVLIVNQVADRLNLPRLLPVQTALSVTNKKEMKRRFTENGIPTTAYAVCDATFKDEDIAHVGAPYVIKPLDSQGQRGIFKVDSVEEIRQKFPEVLLYSRSNEILIESYYKNEEVTVTGWVDEGRLQILTITDRVTFSSDDHIGVCLSHEYPSRHLPIYRAEFFKITERICMSFEIENGPIYFQYLVGDQGVLVNEIACRIGGAYEDVFVPAVTGVDLLTLNILSTVEPTSKVLKQEKEELSSYRYSEMGLRISVQLFFCRPGHIKTLTPRDELVAQPYILDMGYNINEGVSLNTIENASQRAGFVIVCGNTEDEMQSNIRRTFEQLQVLNNENENLIIKHQRKYRA